MSVNASIQINLNKLKCKSFIEILQILTKFGWNFIHNGHLTYSFLNKQGDLDFQAETLTLEQFAEMVQLKSPLYVLISVEMTWQDTEIGGPLMFSPTDGIHQLTLCLESKRQKQNLVDTYETTDFQWYLEKLLPPLDDAFGVESFSFEEQR